MPCRKTSGKIEKPSPVIAGFFFIWKKYKECSIPERQFKMPSRRFYFFNNLHFVEIKKKKTKNYFTIFNFIIKSSSSNEMLENETVKRDKMLSISFLVMEECALTTYKK